MTTANYGEFDDHCPDVSAEATVHAYVATALGDFVGDYDVDGLTDAFRAAINKALDGTGISLAGDKFYGPYPVCEDHPGVIGDAIKSVDFWALAEKFDKTAAPASGDSKTEG